MPIRAGAAAAALAILLAAAAAPADPNSPSGSSPSANAVAPPPASSGIQPLVSAGKLSDLRWPDFSDYQAYVAQFYGAGSFAPVWTGNGKPTQQALAMIQAFKQAAFKGLNPEDYDASRWDARVAKLAPATPNPSAADIDCFDVALTVCAMRYISAVHIGRVNPQRFKFRIDMGPKQYDLVHFLRAQVIGATDVGAILADAEPSYAGYQRAEVALASYLKLAQQGDGPRLPEPASSVHTGDSYSEIQPLAARLRLLGDLPADPSPPAAPKLYQGPIVDGVKHFQQRNGLEPDGVLGKGTVAALNVPLNRRVEELQFTLERYRWMPSGFPEPPIVVNIPEFMLRTMRRQQAPFLAMRVVVGKAYRRETPVFTGNMRYVIFRPYWNVPGSIQRAELLPKLRRDRGYLASHGFEVVDPDGKVVTAGVVSDDVFAGLRSGALNIRQQPGPKNALGLVKFIFPNSYNVYLHSTPAPELFARARRDFSHGCIRVEKPADLAAWVLRDRPEWTMDKILAAMNGSETVQVNLAKPIPVLILYSTAVVEPDGEVHFFRDIYHYDAALRAALAAGYPYPVGTSGVPGAKRTVSAEP